MANAKNKTEQQEAKALKKSSKLGEFIQSNMDKLYQAIHYSDPTNKKDLDNIKSQIDASIDQIVANSTDAIGIPNISKMYSRILDRSKDVQDADKRIEEMLTDHAVIDSTLATFAENSRLSDLDAKIDTIIKYVPRLQEALDVRKDNVLSADHFSKDFITITTSDTVDQSNMFSKRLKELKEKYNLLELFEEFYDDAAKYGEKFVYHVPYNKAITRLLQTKANTRIFNASLKTEAGEIVAENGKVFKMDKPEDNYFAEENYNITLQINRSNMLIGEVDKIYRAASTLSKINETALSHIDDDTEAFTEDKIENIPDAPKKPSKFIDDGFMPDDLDFSAFDDDTSNDGLITGVKDTQKKIKVDVPGCVLRQLDRRCIIPIYIEDYCMGYYYIENTTGQNITDFTKLEDPMLSLRNSSTILQRNEDNMKRDNVLKYLSGQMAKYIDQEFVNNNQDLRGEIYMILKYNDIYNTPNSSFRITFLPPEDVTHIYFKKDPKTHRGISDLDKAIIPATLYASLYITNAIAAMTRGQDKRVYYVKQNVDTNISKTLLTTIEQIKKGNFNIRQIENVNHILNITGRFNDYVIPEGPNGDPPIRFEVMPGQQIDIQNDLMNRLEEMAINTTDVPIELIQARQSIDYAVQLTMTNSKFLRQVYKRQAKYEKFLSKIITKVYNLEYDTNIKLELKLPPPMFLNITNTNQIMMNTNDFAQGIADTYLATEQDETVRNTFIKELKLHYLGSYIDRDEVERILLRAQQDAAVEKSRQTSQESADMSQTPHTVSVQLGADD
ncbi:MAG: hypothetical protein J6Y02_10195 [Pseudobutyrivibrio sp.]|nr:hypothetical protein [Pseudobutyrivibrio sp.]